MLLKDKYTFISGASSGIGKACAYRFAREGSHLILCSRNESKLNEIASDIIKNYDVQVFTFPLDIQNRTAVLTTIASLPVEWQEIDILINNAGLARGFEKFQDNRMDDWEEMIDTNVKGVLYLTKAILPIMLKRNSGHIINMGSTAGKGAYPKGAVYCASKAALKNISDGLRMDLVDTNIRVTEIQPGMVDTDFSLVRFHGDSEKAKQVYNGIKVLSADDVAESVLFAAIQAPHIQIQEICLTSTHQASSTVLHRNN